MRKGGEHSQHKVDADDKNGNANGSFFLNFSLNRMKEKNAAKRGNV